MGELEGLHHIGLGDLLTLDPVATDQLVDADPAGDRGPAVDLFQRVLEHLAKQPHPVGDRPAVLVVAIVQPPRQKVLNGGQAVAGVHIHQVVARPE